MSRMRILSLIRRQDYYKPMLATLAECGVEDFRILPPSGRGHAILAFKIGLAEHRVPLPGTPTGYSEATRYVPAEIRRRARGLHG